MKEYIIKVDLPTYIKINANTEDEAKQEVIKYLMQNNNIKPADYFNLQVVEEVIK